MTGDRLAEYIQDHWLEEFLSYFKIDEVEESSEDDFRVIDETYIGENYGTLIWNCQRMRSTVNGTEWRVICELLDLVISQQGGQVPLADLLMELGGTEEAYSQEFDHLRELGYLDIDEDGFSLDGHAQNLWTLFENIQEEIIEAEEDPEGAREIFEYVIRSLSSGRILDLDVHAGLQRKLCP